MAPQTPIEYRCSVYKFWHQYVPNVNGGLDTVDYVEYGPWGNDKNKTISKVKTLLNTRDIPTSPGGGAHPAIARRDYIQLRYNEWLSGLEAPLNGTPLSAWNGVMTEQADILRMKGFKTVEDVASMTGMHVEKVPLNGMVGIIEAAKRFLAASGTAAAAAEIAAREEETKRLKVELAETREQTHEMAKMLKELQDEMRATIMERRKPGRSRKVEDDLSEDQHQASV